MARLNSEQQALAAQLGLETKIPAESCPQAVIVLGELAAKHQKLMLMRLENGLTAEMEGALLSVERQIQAAVLGVDGLKGVVFFDDPRGTTVGLAFDSGASNSLTGHWKIPVRPGAIDALPPDFWKKHVLKGTPAKEETHPDAAVEDLNQPSL